MLKEKDHRNPCKSKSCGLGEQIPLDRFKDLKNKFPGATINDVMLATLTIMLKQYFKAEGEKSTNVSSNFMINMRPPKQDVLKKSMRNEFSTGVFKFPLHETDPIKVVWAVKNQVDMTKNSPAPLILYRLLAGAVHFLNGIGCRSALINAALDSYGKVTVMLSNVPGPQQTEHMCGVACDDMSFYTFTPLGVYLGVLSYADKVSVGVVTGTAGEPNAKNLAKHWAPAFKELEDAVAAAAPKQLRPPADRFQLYTFASLGLAAALIAGSVGLLNSGLIKKPSW
jgi:hypothetical protein